MSDKLEFDKALNLYRGREVRVYCGKRGDGVYVETSDTLVGNTHVERFSCRELDALIPLLKDCANYLRASREIPN